MSDRSDDLYLDDISSSITQISKYVRGLAFGDFKKDQMTIDAVVRNIEIIGEAANNISDRFKKKYKNFPWNRMIGMRNKVIHEYFGVDLEILWETVKVDLPALRKALQKID